jgi:hypothetical protein
MSTNRPTYCLTLLALPDGVLPPVRLKHLLKVALRIFGLRCIGASEVSPGGAAGALPPDVLPGAPEPSER